jgi:hypothetical protein
LIVSQVQPNEIGCALLVLQLVGERDHPLVAF